MKKHLSLLVLLLIVSTLTIPASAQPLSPAPVQQFEGPDQSGSAIDKAGIAGAVGPNHIVTIRNATGINDPSIYIYNKAGQLVGTKSFNNYFATTISGFTDPRIAYDPTQQRWIACATATYSGVKHLCVMHSLTSDPTGAWDFFTPIFSFFSSMVQPKIGFSNNWIAISCFYQDGYANGSSITYVWKRQDFYSGSALNYWTSQAFGMGHLCPVATYDAGIGDLYLVSVNSAATGGKVRVSRIYGNPSSAPQFDMNGALINVNNAWSSTGPAGPQSGASAGITLPDHRMASAVYRNGSIWFAHNIFLPASGPNRALIQWGQINVSANTLTQLGRIDGGSASLMYALPSIAVDQNSNVLVGFNKFSSSGYASAAYAYRSSTDPSGYMNGVYTYKSGISTFNQNWGDYSATVIDPAENAMWTLQQYARANNKWGTQWAKIGGTISGNCDAPCGNANAEWIANVSVAGQSLPTLGNSMGCGDFFIIDAYTALLKKGIVYPIVLTPGFSGPAQSEYWSIWLDLNHDGDFEDPGELVFNTTYGSTTTVSGNIIVPLSALSGPTVLRVGMRRGSPPPLCGNFNYGQILNYPQVYLIDNDYCDISFTDACTREYIQRVQFNSINHASGCGTNGYQDFTSFSTNVVAGSNYLIQLTPGFVSSPIAERWMVWIDFNKDLDFDDPGEQVFDSGTTGSASITNGYINIPADAQSASTRMRVKMIPADPNSLNNLNPCDPILVTLGFPPDQYGEAEDYTINIEGVAIQIEYDTPESLVQDLLIGGGCYDVSNVTFNGNSAQIGKFSNGLTSIGFDTGIILATGDINVAVGPNDQDGTSGGYGYATPDSNLAQLAGSFANFDLADLEFDITPTQTPLTFQYVFASEEYCEYVGSQFTDAFGLFISGPGINGPFDGADNIATLGSGAYVTINTVNHLSNSGLYVNNTPNSGTLCGQSPATSPAVNELQYDGFTRKLLAYANVIPCETYHIKLKICDVGDGIFDSAVFLKAGSFAGGGNATVHWVVDDQPDATEAYEACSDVKLVFNRLGSNLGQPLTVSYQILGSATQPADYTGIPSSVVIPADLNQITIPVNIPADLVAEGQETITIRLSNPCSCQNPEITLHINDLPNFDANADTVTICGSNVALLNVTPVGGVAPFTYLWNYGGSTTSSIAPFVNVSTNYNVTVTDACGRSVVRTARVIVTSPPNAQLIPPAPQICPNEDANLLVNFNGTGPFSLVYSLNGNQQPEMPDIYDDPFILAVDQPGQYQILWVVDGNGCIGPGIGTLLVTTSTLSLAGTAANVTCHGASNGAINTTVTGGQTPYTYSWSQAGIGNNPDPAGLPPGNYTLTVLDGSGCTLIQQFSVSEPPALALSIGNVQNITCFSPLGSIDLVAFGGTPGYMYHWSNDAAVQDPQNLPAGAYSVTVTDANGCTGISGANITATPPPLPSITATPLCAGVPAILSVSGGSFGSVAWSNGQNTPTISASTPGVYAVTVTDANGCTGTASYTLMSAQPVASIAGIPNFCPGSSTNLTVQGSNFSSVLWSNGSTNTTIPVSQAGAYTATVTNNSGCTLSISQAVSAFMVTSPIINGPSGICQGNTATLTVPGNFTAYNWSTGSQNPTIDISAIGTYSVTTTDLNGCTGTASHALTQVLPSPTPAIQGPATLCSGIAILAVQSPGSYTNWAWSNGPVGTPNNIVTELGQYIVTVTNANGCTGTASHTIDMQSPTAQITGDLSLCPGASGVLTATGMPPGNTLWKNTSGQILGNGPQLGINQPGIYIVEISSTTGNNYCTASDTVVVAQAPVPAATATGGIISCALPAIVIGAGPNGTGFGYTWSGPAGFMSNSQFPLVDTPGTYVVTVSNPAGCTATATATVSLEDKTNTFEITPANPTIGTADPSETEVSIPATIHNLEANNIDIRWTKTYIDLSPPDCMVKVKDKIDEYPASVISGQFSMAPGESAPLNVILIDSDTTTCTGVVYLQFRNLCTLRDTVTAIYSTAVGATDIVTNDMTVMPNPGTGIYHLLKVPKEATSLEIIGVDGRRVLLQRLVPGDQDFNLTGKSAGTYFAVIRNDTGDLVRLFVLILVE